MQSELTVEQTHWTSADLELLPDNSNHYEIIDGELFVAKQPHWHHQRACIKISFELAACRKSKR